MNFYFLTPEATLSRTVATSYGPVFALLTVSANNSRGGYSGVSHLGTHPYTW